MPSGMFWTKEPEGAWMPGYANWVKNTLPAVARQVLEARADEISDWMKAEAVWRDRTGNARRSLHVEIIREDMIISLVMMYTIPIFYSIFLEHMQMGRFSILAPALDVWAPVLLQDLKKALS